MKSTVNKIGNSYWILIPMDVAKKNKVKHKSSFEVHEDLWGEVLGKPHEQS